MYNQGIPAMPMRATSYDDMRMTANTDTGPGGAPTFPWLPFVQALLAVLTVAVIAVAAAPQVLKLTGRQLVVVSGNSMGAAIPNGSGVIAQPRPAESLSTGDVILFTAQWARTDGQPTNVAHRLQLIAPSTRGLLGYTAGDANVLADPEPVVLGEEQPVVVSVIPYLGFVYSSAPNIAQEVALVSLLLAGCAVLMRSRASSVAGKQQQASEAVA